jgi:hypothetical protein
LRTARRMCACILIIAFWQPRSFAQQRRSLTADEQKVVVSLGSMGVSGAELLFTVAKGSIGRPDPANPDPAAKLQSIANAYTSQRDAGRGTVALLNSTFEVALVGTDVVTAGESIIATSGVRYVKNKGLAVLTDKLDEDARKVLATDLKSYEQQHKLNYESLRTKSESEIRESLNNLGAIRDMKELLGDDPNASDAVDKAVIGFIRDTQKATLDKLAETRQQSEQTRGELRALSQSVTEYRNNVGAELHSLSDSISDTQSAVDQAQASLDALKKETEGNSQQLAVVGEFMYGRATAQERLQMLDANYLRDKLPGDAWTHLREATVAEAKREKLMSDVAQVVGDLSQVAQIANNLGIHSPELNQAVRFATTAQSAVSNVLQGNYLGALVGITGLFGGNSDPEAEFHKQLMSYLQTNFQQINDKLNQVLDGEQKIMDGIVKLSEQMAAYDKILHQRLDRIEFKVDTIEALGRQVLYFPLAGCRVTQQNMVQTIKRSGISSINLRDFNQLRLLPSSVQYKSMMDCITYLETIYGVAFDDASAATSFAFDPLSIRYSKRDPNSAYKITKDDEDMYYQKSEIQDFMEKDYNWSRVFVTTHLPKVAITGGKPNEGTTTNFVALLALPSQNVGSYRTKLNTMLVKAPACAQGSLLSEPMLQVLCVGGIGSLPTRATLPGASTSDSEQTAQERAEKVLERPLMHDSLQYLASWAMFWAPVYDYADLPNSKLFTTEADFLKQNNVEPKGPRLLNGALQTLTFGLAQMNMVYGDVPAGLLFDSLWSEQGGLLATDQNATEDQKAAIALLKRENPYLRRNVLMFGLDRAATAGKDAYKFALTYMNETPDERHPADQLDSLFAGKIKFKNVSVPRDGVADCSKPESQKNCYKVPHATIAGIDVPLPTADDFADRKFYYPRTMLELMQSREQVVSALADYNVFDWAVAGAADKKAARDELVRTLLESQH